MEGVVFRSDVYSKIISKLNMYDEAEFGIDDISEEEYNKLKERTMPKKKKKAKKKKRKSKKKKK
jgi:hypothetical protein